MRAVIDTSVVLASLLEDEPAYSSATALLQNFLASDLELLSISLLPYELANGLWQAVRKGRVTAKDVVLLLETFEQFELPLYAVRPAEVVSLAERLQCPSAYDAAYLALAEREKAPLVTADKRLYNAVRDSFPWIVLVEDFAKKAD